MQAIRKTAMQDDYAHARIASRQELRRPRRNLFLIGLEPLVGNIAVRQTLVSPGRVGTIRPVHVQPASVHRHELARLGAVQTPEAKLASFAVWAIFYLGSRPLSRGVVDASRSPPRQTIASPLAGRCSNGMTLPHGNLALQTLEKLGEDRPK